MDKSILLQRLEAHEIFATPGALDLLLTLPDEHIEKIISAGLPIITEEDIHSSLHLPPSPSCEPQPPVEVVRSPHFRPIAKEYSAQISFTPTPVESCGGEVENFVHYFTSRLDQIRRIIRMRPGNADYVRISGLRNHIEEKNVRVIGIVNEKRVSKKGNALIELEDETGTITVIVPRKSSAFPVCERIVPDEVIGIDGRLFKRDFFIAEEIIFPEVPIRELKRTEEDLAIAFLSDTHVGSKLFLCKPFQHFLQWLRGMDGMSKREMELAGKVKYLIVAGDIVDGIGIYPTQELELEQKDIYQQYAMFETLMENVPDYIEVIVAPGNHDAVRRAEPQPPLPKEFFPHASFHRISNPSTVILHGLSTLVYHGTSLDSLIATIPGLSYEHPEKCMQELLKRRLLSPIYGENPIVPTSRDVLTIVEPPDILHMGHVHTNGYTHYSGTVLINSGTWQDRTEFQIRQGHVPTPAQLPVFEMKYGRISVIDFLKQQKESVLL